MPTKKLRDNQSEAPMKLSAAMGHGKGTNKVKPVSLLKHNLKNGSGAGKGKMKGLNTRAGYDTKTKVNFGGKSTKSKKNG